MKKIKFYASLDHAGGEYEDELEIKRNATEEEISKLVFEKICGKLDWSWTPIDFK
jgi:hypothetical protein